MSELKPCPFCGGEPVLKQYRADGLETKCSSCHSGRQQRWMHKGRDWLSQKMIEKWNERAVLAQEAGHVEELLGMVEPTAWLLDGSVGGSSLDFQITDLLETQNRHGGCLVPLFRVPPAPVSVVLPEREHVPETELYNTNIDEVAYAEGWNNAIDKVKELNQ